MKRFIKVQMTKNRGVGFVRIDTILAVYDLGEKGTVITYSSDEGGDIARLIVDSSAEEIMALLKGDESEDEEEDESEDEEEDESEDESGEAEDESGEAESGKAAE